MRFFLKVLLFRENQQLSHSSV